MPEENAIEPEVYIQSINFVIRPDGSDAVRIDFIFDMPIKPIEKEPKGYVLNVTPQVPLSTPREIKAMIILSIGEWREVKDKYQVGQTYKFKVIDSKIVIE